MITANLAVVPRGVCMAGVAVFCGGLYLAWSYWNHTGNSDDTDGNYENIDKTSRYSAATEPTRNSSSTVEGSANHSQKILNDKEKSKNEGKRKRRSTKEELLLKNAIEFTRTQIASTESLSKQLLISEQRKKVVTFSSSPEIITVTPKDSIKKKSSVLKTPNGELFKNGTWRKEEMIRHIYSGDKIEPRENNHEVKSKEKKMKSSDSPETITVTPNNITKETFSDPKASDVELTKDGTLTKEDMFRKNHSSDKNEPRENNHKNLKEDKVKEEKMKSAEFSEIITVIPKDIIKKKSSVLKTSSIDKLFKDGTLTKEEVIQNNHSGDRNEPQENNHKNLKEEKDKDEKVKAEVENVLSEVLAVVDCRDQVKEHATRKTAEPTLTDREFVSFMYVNQGYFNTPSAGYFPVAS